MQHQIIKDINPSDLPLPLRPAIKFLEQRCCEDIKLEDIAEAAEISEEHLCRLFKKSLRVSPGRYRMMLRVEKAMELIVRDPFRKLFDIALDVGYSGASGLEHAFRELGFPSPSEFRKKALPESIWTENQSSPQ